MAIQLLEYKSLWGGGKIFEAFLCGLRYMNSQACCNVPTTGIHWETVLVYTCVKFVNAVCVKSPVCNVKCPCFRKRPHMTPGRRQRGRVRRRMCRLAEAGHVRALERWSAELLQFFALQLGGGHG